MRALAAFVMRGRWAAAAVMVLTGLVPMIAWLGGGVLALVSLRRGAAEGALVAAMAAAAFVALAAVSGAPPLAMAWTLLTFWLPLWLTAIWLRWTVSLSGAMQLAAALAGLAVTGFYLYFGGDPGAFWEQRFREAGAAFGVSAGNPEAWEAFTRRMVPVMTGLWALNLLGLVLAGLLLGRWWQALLYNPGGFRAEFHELRLDRWFAIATVVLALAASISGQEMLADLGLVLSSVFVFQALALAHWVAAKRSWNRIGLIVLYALMPILFQVYALIGIADVFFDIRRRLVGAGKP